MLDGQNSITHSVVKKTCSELLTLPTILWLRQPQCPGLILEILAWLEILPMRKMCVKPRKSHSCSMRRRKRAQLYLLTLDRCFFVLTSRREKIKQQFGRVIASSLKIERKAHEFSLAAFCAEPSYDFNAPVWQWNDILEIKLSCMQGFKVWDLNFSNPQFTFYVYTDSN